MTDNVNRIMDFFPKNHVRIVFIDHPFEDCVKSVRERGHNIKEQTIERLHRKCGEQRADFINEGYDVQHLNREYALQYCKEQLCPGSA